MIGKFCIPCVTSLSTAEEDDKDDEVEVQDKEEDGDEVEECGLRIDCSASVSCEGVDVSPPLMVGGCDTECVSATCRGQQYQFGKHQ